MNHEEALTGGNSTAVTRMGDTVLRETGPWTPQVHRLLRHLRAAGITEVPVPLGFAPDGREILTYLPGTVGHGPLPETLRTDAILVSAARLLRRIHDATAPVARGWLSGWQALTRDPVEVICHGDFAPYNCVFQDDQLAGVFDFDHAHPGSRGWDLAYAIYRFAPLADPSNPESYGTTAEQCRRVRLVCDAYGYENRTPLPAILNARLTAMVDYLQQGAQIGDPRRIANIAEGHLAIYTTDITYLENHQDQLHQALR